MRVVYFGTYRSEYARNRILIAGLEAVGVEVSICHESLWTGIEDRVQTASGGWMRPSFCFRFLRAYFRLLWRGLRLGKFDVLVCGYPGQVDVFLARLIAWLHRKPLVWDVFMSIYLISLERGLYRSSAFTVGLIKWLERLALRLPEALIQDTHAYIEWFRRTYAMDVRKFHIIPTGADERLFLGNFEYEPEAVPFQVIYYGTYIPNHGVPTIAQAILKLREVQSIQFTLIGDGPQREEVESIIQAANPGNVRIINWMAQEELLPLVEQAGLLLGAFGTTPQSLMTIHNKIYEGLALGIPVLTGDSATLREELAVGKEVVVCKRDDPEDLAQLILELYQQPELRKCLAEGGRRAFVERYSIQHQGQRFKKILLELAGGDE